VLELKPDIPPNRKIKLVIFDVEGVLVPKNRFAIEVARRLGLSNLLKIYAVGFLYQIGVLGLKSALKRVYMAMKGAKKDCLIQVLEESPLLPSAIEVFTRLKVQGYKTALISSGLPTLVVKELANLVNADYAFGVEIGLKDEALTGEIWGEVTESGGKRHILSKIMTSEGLSPSQCAVVVDDRNNKSLFLPGVDKIGFNPDFWIRIRADKIVVGNLSKIIPIIEGRQTKRSFPSKFDLFRESIHASGFLLALLCLFVGKLPVISFVAAMLVVYLISETVRLWGKNMPIISFITRLAASQSEIGGFVGAPIYFAVGIILTLLLFKTPASYAAVACFALGDSAASIFGGTISKRNLPFNKSKTPEGSLAGFLFAFLGAMVFVSPPLALAGAAIATTIEALPLPINDNLMIPLFTGLALSILI
jgi:dolichol kinase/phosphoserine phosphatase